MPPIRETKSETYTHAVLVKEVVYSLEVDTVGMQLLMTFHALPDGQNCFSWHKEVVSEEALYTAEVMYSILESICWQCKRHPLRSLI